MILWLFVEGLFGREGGRVETLSLVEVRVTIISVLSYGAAMVASREH